MNKKELISVVSQKTGFAKQDAETMLSAITDTIIGCLSAGEKVQLSGFGSFDLKKRAAKMARNPRTGETIPLPQTFRPVFTPGKEMKGLIK